jgi:deferrochelatase/peroxidase EfeB
MQAFIQLLIQIIEKNPQLIVQVIQMIIEAFSKNPALVTAVVQGFALKVQ